jgi:hypothetical protein
LRSTTLAGKSPQNPRGRPEIRTGVFPGGELNLESTNSPTFKLNASITNMDLRALNPFMRAYGNFDIEKGIFSVFTEVASADGKYEGYVKPFFINSQVLDWDKERKKNIVDIFWEALLPASAISCAINRLINWPRKFLFPVPIRRAPVLFVGLPWVNRCRTLLCGLSCPGSSAQFACRM